MEFCRKDEWPLTTREKKRTTYFIAINEVMKAEKDMMDCWSYKKKN